MKFLRIFGNTKMFSFGSILSYLQKGEKIKNPKKFPLKK